jgi:hypothetical protein
VTVSVLRHRQQRLLKLSAAAAEDGGSALAAAVGPQRERVLANLQSLAEIDPVRDFLPSWFNCPSSRALHVI